MPHRACEDDGTALIMERLDHIALKVLHRMFRRRQDVRNDPDVICDPQKASDMIAAALSGPEPCMICRYGGFELQTVANYLSIKDGRYRPLAYVRGDIMEWWWNRRGVEFMKNNAGFFPNTEENLCRFSEMMLEDSAGIDILGSWIPDEKQLSAFQPESMKKVLLPFLEPFFAERPWTSALAGKKVLVVHPFAELIESQYARRESLFNTADMLPEFELQTLKAVQSIGGVAPGFDSWFDALEYMKSEIDRRDYDICLLGCGAYGFPLAAHVKRSGRKAFHLGGALQLLFGIRGRRWEDPMQGVADWGLPLGSYTKLMNENWVRPGDELKPSGAAGVEGGCYW